MLFSKHSLGYLLIVGTQSVAANPIPDSGLGLDLSIDPFLNTQLDTSAITLFTGTPVINSAVNVGVNVKRSPEPEGEGFEDLSARAFSVDEIAAFKWHNKFRALKNLTRVVWDTTLQAHAQTWANHLASIDQMVHSTNDARPGEGENLAFASSTQPIPYPMTIGTKGWLAEYKNYHNEIIPQGTFEAYGHYTQCMWSTTTKVGIATASNGKGGWYTVGRYAPAGNIVGQRPY